jgi:glucose-6-phosphate 1-dehydrogenase
VDRRIETLVIFGAGGDLTSRLLLPGVASYLGSDRGKKLLLIGVDRAERTDHDWRATVRKAFRASPSDLADDVAENAIWMAGDVTQAAELERILAATKGRTALYFALPPAVTLIACEVLATIHRPEGLALALEKPFGTDLASAEHLNRLLETMMPETQLFRVDHFLGKSTVLNLLGLRFANRIFEPLLSAENVERVDIIFDEELALEGRAGYYDQAGALRDMIQSHLLLVLALTTMEPPASLDSEDLRGAMAQVLRATRPLHKNGTASRRGRYGPGKAGRKEVLAYLAEPGVDASRHTETWAEMTVVIDNWRWAGVPFVLSSGKAMGDACQDVLVTFKPVPHLPTGLTGVTGPSQLRLSLKPPRLDLDLVINGEGNPFELERVALSASMQDGELTAYGEVLAGLLEGDPVLSVRGDVAEQCWRIVEPVLHAWEADRVPLETYPAGSTWPPLPLPNPAPRKESHD